MGKDGTQEFLTVKNAGALTFAQSSDSAVVFGMPGEAIRLDAARYVMTPAEIGSALSAIIG
jgi:two-component system chemotaxis response regulator CheB